MITYDKRWKGVSSERVLIRDQILSETGVDILGVWTLSGDVWLTSKNWIRWIAIYHEEAGWVLSAWINPVGTCLHAGWIRSRGVGLEVIKQIVERSVGWCVDSRRSLDSFPELSALVVAGELVQDGKVFILFNETAW